MWLYGMDVTLPRDGTWACWPIITGYRAHFWSHWGYWEFCCDFKGCRIRPTFLPMKKQICKLSFGKFAQPSFANSAEVSPFFTKGSRWGVGGDHPTEHSCVVCWSPLNRNDLHGYETIALWFLAEYKYQEVNESLPVQKAPKHGSNLSCWSGHAVCR